MILDVDTDVWRRRAVANLVRKQNTRCKLNVSVRSTHSTAALRYLRNTSTDQPTHHVQVRTPVSAIADRRAENEDERPNLTHDHRLQ